MGSFSFSNLKIEIKSPTKEKDFLFSWKNDHNAAASAQNVNVAFGDGSVSECTIRRRYTKFESDHQNLPNEALGRQEAVVENEILRAIVEQNPGNTVRYYGEDLGDTPTILSRYLK
ncbi:hypothetical protein TNIN_196431 [Trichonephila inaurata madagascariensis]|uniref:Mos1 transposase HTH domain-containing protein n=1 Tax=Trichonephila inaurata madagascariensis TaxID=2747483 RepID=A0A8X6YJR5_9ARAC|nr:hypothetical protein TNIN_196431 [Trichonephila inaurata madagascariensis]